MMGSILWGIKGSLLSYVAGASGGRVELDGVEQVDEVFSFPLASVDGVPGEGAGVAKATGSVRLFGHFGMAIQELHDPWVEWDGDRAVMSIAAEPGGERRIVAWDLSPLVHRDGEYRAGLVRLTAAGSSLFGQQYPQATEFDPLIVRFASQSATG